MKFRIILTMSVCVIGWRAHRWIWGTLRRVCCFGGRSVGWIDGERSAQIEGSLLIQLDRLEEAEGVFLRFNSMFESDGAMAENGYDLAWVLRKQNRVDEALVQLPRWRRLLRVI